MTVVRSRPTNARNGCAVPASAPASRFCFCFCLRRRLTRAKTEDGDGDNHEPLSSQVHTAEALGAATPRARAAAGDVHTRSYFPICSRSFMWRQRLVYASL